MPFTPILLLAVASPFVAPPKVATATKPTATKPEVELAPTTTPTAVLAPRQEPAPPAEPATEPSAAPVDDEGADGGNEPFDLQPAAPGSRDPQKLGPYRGRRPSTSVWGDYWLSVGVLVNTNAVGLGVGGVRFLVPYFGIGLDIDDTVVFDRAPYNAFRITPKAVLLLAPYRRVTPVVTGGFGGAFFSPRLGAYGRWVTGAGLKFAIGERYTFGFGMDVDGYVPESRLYRNFECSDGSHECAIGLTPWVSFGILSRAGA